MKEKITGLEVKDFLNMNVAITSLIKEYQAIVNTDTPLADYWQKQIACLHETQAKLRNNRSFE